MGNHHWLKTEYVHMVGNPESKQLKVAALNLLHPTASPLFRKAIFSHCDTRSQGGRVGMMNYALASGKIFPGL